MIRFKNVNFNYQNKLTILKDFNIEFEDNKINCIVGPSGVGKSTLLNILSHLLKPQSGNINGLPKKVSYLFQEERLINEITVYQNLDFILKKVYLNKVKRHKLIIESLNRVGLSKTENWYPQQLSASMKRRLAMVRAFLYPSDLLLMDEPFTGLDINIKHQITNLFIKLWQKDKRTVVFVSHDLDETISLANNIYLMTNKPMQVKEVIKIKTSQNKRSVTSKESINTKKSLLNLIRKW